MTDKCLSVNEQSKSKDKQMASMTPPPPKNPSTMNINPQTPATPSSTEGCKSFEESQ